MESVTARLEQLHGLLVVKCAGCGAMVKPHNPPGWRFKCPACGLWQHAPSVPKAVGLTQGEPNATTLPKSEWIGKWPGASDRDDAPLFEPVWLIVASVLAPVLTTVAAALVIVAVILWWLK